VKGSARLSRGKSSVMVGVQINFENAIANKQRTAGQRLTVCYLRGEGAAGRAFPGDGARFRLPVERPRRVPGAQEALSPRRDRDGDARRRPASGAQFLLFRSGFSLAAAVRLASRHTTESKSSLKKHGAITNGLLGALCAAELPLFPLNRLAGLSAFVLAKKALSRRPGSCGSSARPVASGMKRISGGGYRFPVRAGVRSEIG
jgi:hypothetical protein